MRVYWEFNCLGDFVKYQISHMQRIRHVLRVHAYDKGWLRIMRQKFTHHEKNKHHNFREKKNN